MRKLFLPAYHPHPYGWGLPGGKVKSESGYLIAALPLVFLLLVITVCTARACWDAAAADVLKGAAEFAVKAAANQHTGCSMIDPNSALQAFEEILAENLELDGSLEPDKYSLCTAKPDFSLLIYNGTSGVEYLFEDGVLSVSETAGEGFPQSFVLSDGTNVVLTSPGVVAEVEIKTKELFGREVNCRRWAAARVAQLNGAEGVVLVGRASDEASVQQTADTASSPDSSSVSDSTSTSKGKGVKTGLPKKDKKKAK